MLNIYHVTEADRILSLFHESMGCALLLLFMLLLELVAVAAAVVTPLF